MLDRALAGRRVAVEARDGRAVGAARRQLRAALLPLRQVLRARPDAAARPAHPVRRVAPLSPSLPPRPLSVPSHPVPSRLGPLPFPSRPVHH